MKIPKKLKLFGFDIEVEFDDKLSYEQDALGLALFHKNKIILQSNNPEKPTPQVQIEKHFFHELTHWILYVIGEETLTHNEKFVDLFARVLHQAIVTMEY